MTEPIKIAFVQQLLNGDEEAKDELIQALLEEAKGTILTRLYPFSMDDEKYEKLEVPSRYHTLQCKLAQRYFLRMGAEGEIEHSENGIIRKYASVEDEDLLKEITPFAKVIG